MARSPKTSQGGASLSSKVQYHSGQCCLYSLNLQLDNRHGSSHPRLIASRGDTCHHPHRFNELATQIGMGSLDWNVSMVDIHLWKLLWVYCPRHAWVKGNDRAGRPVGKATLTSDLLLGRSEVLRSLRHYLQAQSQGHHIVNRLEERGVESGSARWSFLKGWERAIINPMNIETVSKETGQLMRDGVEHIWAFPSTYITSWTELNSHLCTNLISWD